MTGVQTCALPISAHRSGVDFTGFHRENTLCLRVGDDCLYPDDAFRLALPDGSEFGFFTEVDAGSERIASKMDVESWERKIRLYDRLQDQSPKRFRVLIVSTQSRERVRHILELAGRLVRNPQRSLFYGIGLPDYLAESDPLRSACFRDHRGEPAALLPERYSTPPAWNPPPTRAPPPSRLPSLTT